MATTRVLRRVKQSACRLEATFTLRRILRRKSKTEAELDFIVQYMVKHTAVCGEDWWEALGYRERLVALHVTVLLCVPKANLIQSRRELVRKVEWYTVPKNGEPVEIYLDRRICRKAYVTITGNTSLVRTSIVCTYALTRIL